MKSFDLSKLTFLENTVCFWNDYLIALNACNRVNVTQSKCHIHRFNQKNDRFKSLFFSIKVLIASFLNLLHLMLFAERVVLPVKITITPFEPLDKYSQQLYRVGLHNYRQLSVPHILQSLEKVTIFKYTVQAAFSYQKFTIRQKKYVQNNGVNWNNFSKLIDYNFFRFLDAYLHARLFESLLSTVRVYEHFGVYNSLLSLAKKKNPKLILHGYQHGLIEAPPAYHEYYRIKVDKYYLKYSQSMSWIQDHFIESDSFNIINPPNNSDPLFFAMLESDIPVIAYAMSEGLENDFIIVEELIRLSSIIGYKLIFYTHPTEGVPLAMQNIIGSYDIFEKTRHRDIDLLVARYSSLGLDYVGQHIPVLFIPMGQDVCAFYSNDKNIHLCRSFGEVSSSIRELVC